jgi:hypothetical protein
MGAITSLYSGASLPDLRQMMAELRPIQHGAPGRVLEAINIMGAEDTELVFIAL